MEDIYEELYCPITGAIMLDPVTADDGNSYEKTALVKFLNTYSGSKRIMGVEITAYKPNRILKNIIEKILKENPKLKEQQFTNPLNEFHKALKTKDYEKLHKIPFSNEIYECIKKDLPTFLKDYQFISYISKYIEAETIAKDSEEDYKITKDISTEIIKEIFKIASAEKDEKYINALKYCPYIYLSIVEKFFKENIKEKNLIEALFTKIINKVNNFRFVLNLFNKLNGYEPIFFKYYNITRPLNPTVLSCELKDIYGFA